MQCTSCIHVWNSALQCEDCRQAASRVNSASNQGDIYHMPSPQGCEDPTTDFMQCTQMYLHSLSAPRPASWPSAVGGQTWLILWQTQMKVEKASLHWSPFCLNVHLILTHCIARTIANARYNLIKLQQLFMHTWSIPNSNNYKWLQMLKKKNSIVLWY